MQNQTDDSAQEMLDRSKQLAKNTTNRALAKGKKASVKLAAKAGKKLAMLLIKGLAALITPILPVIIPVLIGFFILLGLFHLSWEWEYEYKPDSENIQPDAGSAENEVQSDGNGGVDVTTISNENLMYRAFYMNFANQSYFQHYQGKQVRAGEVLTASGIKGVNENGEPIEVEVQVVDKYSRESSFMLSDTLLWTLDNFLHRSYYRYPEAFLKPLYMDNDLNVKELIDDEGNILAQSNEYDENGNRLNTKTSGTWDYGLAPTINYQSYDEDSEYRYNMTEKQIIVGRDEEGYGGEVLWVSVPEDEPLLNNETFANFATRVEGYPQTVFMIDKAATFLGTIKNEISFEWLDSKRLAPTVDKTYTNDVIKTKTVDWVHEDKLDHAGNQVVQISGVVNGQHKLITTSKGYYTALSSTIYKIGGANYYFDKPPTIYYPKEWKEVVTITEDPVTLNVRYEGTRFDLIPYYVGTPDLTGYLGDSYLEAYVRTYQNYVPKIVATDLDLTIRIEENREELESLAAQYSFYKGSFGNYESVDVKEGSVSSFQNASDIKYATYFQKYADMYGIDTELLRAIAAQESGGRHEETLPGGKSYNGAAVGLMQIEKPGTTVKQVTATDISGNKETVYVCYPGEQNNPVQGCLDVLDLENNIKVGTMQLMQRLERFDYNLFIALQSYNYGETGVRTVLKLYQQQEGKSVQSTISDYKDTEWMKYRMDIHLNPSILGSSYSSWKTYGDPIYVENVLRYFPNDKDISIQKASGETIHFSPDLSNLGSAVTSTTVSNGTSFSQGVKAFFKNVWTRLSGNYSNFFEYKEQFPSPSHNAKEYKSELDNYEVENLLKTIIAIDEGTRIDGIELTDEIWKDKINSMFSNPFQVQFALDNSGNYQPDPYFGGNATTPIEKSIMKVLKEFSITTGDVHKGVDYFAPIGTKIYSIFEGTVVSIEDSDEHSGYTIVIDHGAGMEGHYGSMDKETLKVSVGDNVKKGDTLGLVAEAPKQSLQFFHFSLKKDGDYVNPTPVFSGIGGGNPDNYEVTASGTNFIIPVEEGRVTYEWRDPSYPTHDAIDIGKPSPGQSYNPKIIAANGGTVYEAGWHSLYGLHVKMKHEINGVTYKTIYAHMSKLNVSAGQQIEAGHVVGIMGNTGNSSGTHLDFSIYKGSNTYGNGENPRNYLPNLPSKGVAFKNPDYKG